jgi:hypothetical protein
MKMLVELSAMSGIALALTMPVSAHHAFGGEFDANRPILLKGKVTQVQWVNPHVWIHIDVEKDDGTTEEWMVEGGSPNTLMRYGLSGDAIELGTEVVVDGYQARDPTLRRANGRNITFPDGRQLLLGSSRGREPGQQL